MESGVVVFGFSRRVSESCLLGSFTRRPQPTKRPAAASAKQPNETPQSDSSAAQARSFVVAVQ